MKDKIIKFDTLLETSGTWRGKIDIKLSIILLKILPELKKHLRALEKKSDFIVSGKELLESLNELDKKKTK